MEAEALVPKLTAEALDKGILYGRAEPDELERHAVLMGPQVESLPGELWAVVAPDAAGEAMGAGALFENLDDACARQGVARDDGHRFAAVVIDDVEAAEHALIRQRVADEGRVPAFGAFRCLSGGRCSGGLTTQVVLRPFTTNAAAPPLPPQRPTPPTVVGEHTASVLTRYRSSPSGRASSRHAHVLKERIHLIRKYLCPCQRHDA